MVSQTPAWQKREDLFIVPPGGWMLALTLLCAVALAGGRPLWAQGLVTIGVGLLWVFWPPVNSPTKSIVWILGLLVFLPLAAYLPWSFFPQPDWRAELSGLVAITPSVWVSPQPWCTFHVWLLWLAGTSLAAWCAAQKWDHYNRDTLARMYAGGLAGIVIFAIYGYSTGNNPALWQSTDGFGPFANRNQWGSTMGMGGVIALAILHQSLRHMHKRGVIFWAAAFILITGAVIANGSRGGLLVLATGSFAYGMFFALMRKQYRYAAVSVSLLFISFAAFSVGGGALLERFVGSFEEGLSADRRVEFYRMALNMVKDAPFTGFGLGNFEYVFPFYMDYEPIADTRPIHPENSLIWLASEGGWALVGVALVAICMVIGLGYTARRSRATTIRAAGLACALVIVVNAFYEVSAHRIGSLFPAIMLASLALPSASGVKLNAAWRWAARSLGAILLTIGLVWFVTLFGVAAFPSVQGTRLLGKKAGQADEQGRKGEALAMFRQISNLRPLDWGAHWTLANFYLSSNQPDDAWNEFRAVEALLPYMDSIVRDEGNLWLPTNPSRAAYAWNETLRRAPAGKRAEMYSSFLQQAAESPGLYAVLLRFYPDDPEFEFVRMRMAGPSGANRLPRLLAKTDNLSYAPDHMVESVMRFMLDSGRSEDVRALAARSPRVRRLAWRTLSQLAASDGNAGEALELYFKHGPRPALPAPISRSDLRSVERAAALAPMDLATGIAYYQSLESARRADDAFWQLRRLMELPSAPPYVWYLAAKAAHERGLDEEAWQFLRTYENKSQK